MAADHPVSLWGRGFDRPGHGMDIGGLQVEAKNLAVIMKTGFNRPIGLNH